MKRISTLLAVILIISSLLPLSVAAAPVEKGYVPSTTTEITAKGVYLKNLDTGEVIYEKDADTPLYPASLTKVMTVLLALENYENTSTEMLTYPQEVQDYLYLYQLENGPVSSGWLKLGDRLSLEDYIYAAMLPSANEAALTIALHMDDSFEAFAERMNTRAAELGATSTKFKNPTGLFDPEHVTTARDLALITEEALQYDSFEKIMSTYTHTVGPIKSTDSLTWVSTIEMQNPESDLYYEGLSGVKTGTLTESGRCFISTINKNGYRYLLVLLGCEWEPDADGNYPVENRAFVEATAIYDWLFTSFRNQTIEQEGTVVGQVGLNLCWEQDTMQVVTKEHFTAFMPDNVDIATEIKRDLDIPQELDAPVEKGQQIGYLVFSREGEELGRISVVSASSAKLSGMLVFRKQLAKITSSFLFKFIVVLFVLLIAGYIALLIIRNRNLQRRRSRSGRKPPQK